jgi:hypothetical protein
LIRITNIYPILTIHVNAGRSAHLSLSIPLLAEALEQFVGWREFVYSVLRLVEHVDFSGAGSPNGI